MLQPGDTIRGYRVDALLGEGGMAWVYAATRETDGTRAALKILKSARPEGGRRVLREAAAQQDIHHRHVVQVYDVIEVDERPALVMERVNGPSLQQWLLDRRPSAEDALTVFRGVLAGVQIAHREGMVHRDLKPSNVLLSIDTDGLVPKVADFGLAKPSHRSDFSTQSGVMLGTRGYMAPEQIRDSKSVDLRADVFSLGVLLYELICGQMPFEGTDVVAVYTEIMAGSYQDPASLGASPVVADAIHQALSADPSDRPVDASALAALLDPGATIVERIDDEVVVLAWTTEGAQRARSLWDVPDGAVDPMLPALRTKISILPGGLVGRENELEALTQTIQTPGLVTLHGPAGVGKSALVRALCRQQGSMGRVWTGGVWWVSLRDVQDVVGAIEQVLGIPEQGQIAAALRNRGRLLLVLDEAEQLGEGLRESLADWLAEGTRATVLVTSRISLGLDIERVVPLEPLDEAAAVALFVQRTRLNRPDWSPSSVEREVICELVHQLDQLPLAVELAAARCRVLAPKDLLSRIGRRLDLLRRDDPDPRMASLRGAISASWELLSPDEQRSACFLSVAVGSVNPSSAFGLLDQVTPDPLLTLEALADASWLTPCQGKDGSRFRILESLRAFAREHLTDEDRALAYGAHRDTWVRRGVEACKAFRETGDTEAAALLAEELEDLLVIAERFPGHELAIDALMIAGRWLFERGDTERARRVAKDAVAALDEGSATLPSALLLFADTLVKHDPPASRQAALRAAELTSDEVTWGWVQILLARAEENTDGSMSDLEGAIEVGRKRDEPLLEAAGWMQLCARNISRGNFDIAEDAAEEARALYGVVQHRPRYAYALSEIGLVRIRAQRSVEAEAPLRDAVQVAGELGDARSQAASLGRLSMVLADSGRRREAQDALQRALALCREIGDRVGEGYCLVNLGALQPEPILGADLFRRAAVIARQVQQTRLLNLSESNVGIADMLRGKIDSAIAVFRSVHARLLEKQDVDASRVGAWLAMCLAYQGDLQAAGPLLAVEAEGEWEKVLQLARLVPAAVADPSFDWRGEQERLIASCEDYSWNVTLTAQAVVALLASPADLDTEADAG